MALFVNIANNYCVSCPLFSAVLVNEDEKGTLGRKGLLIVIPLKKSMPEKCP